MTEFLDLDQIPVYPNRRLLIPKAVALVSSPALEASLSILEYYIIDYHVCQGCRFRVT